jgi:hypothetical protein
MVPDWVRMEIEEESKTYFAFIWLCCCSREYTLPRIISISWIWRVTVKAILASVGTSKSPTSLVQTRYAGAAHWLTNMLYSHAQRHAIV